MKLSTEMRTILRRSNTVLITFILFLLIVTCSNYPEDALLKLLVGLGLISYIVNILVYAPHLAMTSEEKLTSLSEKFAAGRLTLPEFTEGLEALHYVEVANLAEHFEPDEMYSIRWGAAEIFHTEWTEEHITVRNSTKYGVIGLYTNGYTIYYVKDI